MRRLSDVISSQVGITSSADDLKDAFVQLEDGDVEGATAKVVNGDYAVLLLIETIGEGSSGGFIHQAKNFQAGDAAGVFRSLTLGIVEVRGER